MQLPGPPRRRMRRDRHSIAGLEHVLRYALASQGIPRRRLHLPKLRVTVVIDGPEREIHMGISPVRCDDLALQLKYRGFVEFRLRMMRESRV